MFDSSPEYRELLSGDDRKLKAFREHFKQNTPGLIIYSLNFVKGAAEFTSFIDFASPPPSDVNTLTCTFKTLPRKKKNYLLNSLNRNQFRIAIRTFNNIYTDREDDEIERVRGGGYPSSILYKLGNQYKP